MPALMHFYPGLTPPAFDDLTPREIAELVDFMRRTHQAAEDARARARRRR